MQILDGKKTSIDIQEELSQKVRQITKSGKKAPHLAAILVGEDGPSKTYVNAKVKACERVGFKSTLIQLNSNVSEKEILNQVDLLNKNKDIDGFIVQLPLPKHMTKIKLF